MIPRKYTLTSLIICALLLPAALAGPDSWLPEQVLRGVVAALTGDWNGDGALDRAVLWQPSSDDDVVNLYVFLSGEEPLVLAGAAWSGQAWGTFPSLSQSRGGFEVVSGNDAVGRNRWRESLTVAYLKGRLRVVAYHYQSRDTLDPQKAFECGADFNTGRGRRNDTAFAVVPSPVPLKKWSAAKIPAPCKAH